MAQHAATPVCLLLLPPPFKVPEQNTPDSSGAGIRSVRTLAHHETLSPSKPNPPTRTACLPPPGLSLAAEVQAVERSEALPPLPPRQNLAFLCSAHLRSPAGEGSSRAAGTRLSPSTPGNAESKGRTAQLPELKRLGKRVSEARGPPPLQPRRRVWGHRSRSVGGGRECGEGGPDCVQTLGNRVASLEPGLLAEWRTEGGGG